MKYKNKKIAKTGVAFVLATSMLANTMEGIFAESENNVQEDTSKELSVKDEEIVEEVNVEAVEREKEVEAFLQTAPVVETEEKEASLAEEKQSASYVLSWAKFRNEYEKLMSIQGSTVTFTNQPVPAGTTTKDLTDTNDRSVVSYRVGNDLIVTTNGVDQKIKFPARSDYLFANIGNIFTTDNEVTAIDLSNVDTSDVVSFREMFSGCEKVVNLDLSNFDTSKATTMYRMFFYSRSLVNVDLTSFDTSNVTNMNGMFENCDALEIADVSRFNTEKVTDMWRMFYDCEKLTTIDTSNFKVPNLEYMSGMFSGCKSVTKLDLSGFNTEKVTNMDSLFNYCESLVSLDLSHFNTDNVDNMQSMFY
ncbi:MAG: BspA family leucine-rich repeat surface protein, partial [Erysipelotrichaceae bacterium]|nr:BspA family leucine-rich repeat surface protein [Erysipelotrichaceae bacterium]